MMAARPLSASFEDRAEPREETLHRIHARDADGGDHVLTIVNVSPNGFMARCDSEAAVGAILSVSLPTVGDFHAEVRWSLGGRLGCRLNREIPPALYQFALAAMR